MGLFDKFKKISKKESSSRGFRLLDILINGNLNDISLDSNIILDDGEEKYYLEGIEINRDNIVIDGNGLTIDAKGKTRIFDINAKNVTLKNIKLINGYSLNGGGIFNCSDSVLEIVGCEFRNNVAQDNGGALINQGKVILKDNSIFYNNSTEKKTGGGINN